VSARLKQMWASAHRGRMLRAILLCGAALASGIVVLGLQGLRMSRGVQAFDSEQAALQVAHAESAALRMLAGELGEREARVAALRVRGFTAEADRVGWVEAVSAAAESLRPLRFAVEVGAESTLPLPPATQAWYDERGLAAPRLAANELMLEVEGLHEGEIVALLARAREAGGAVVRVERCRLERRADMGVLGAVCTLRRFALLAPESPETAGSQGSTT
jgi:hypothetical protein